MCTSIFRFSRSLCTSSYSIFLFSWSSTTSGPNKYLHAATWRLAMYCSLLAIALSAFSFCWQASLSRFIPFLACSWLRYCTNWSTRVPVIPWLKFSPDGRMKETGWLLFAFVCRFEVLISWITCLLLLADLRYLSVEFPEGVTSWSSMDPNLCL